MKNKNRMDMEEKDRAIEIILGMKRYYAQKSDKHLIDKEIERLVGIHKITYEDVWKYANKIKKGIIKPYWK